MCNRIQVGILLDRMGCKSLECVTGYRWVYKVK
jgi:hypothetical protein